MPNQYAEFERLSLKDLIEARDLFHVHLMNKGNVVATALGKYRVRLGQIKNDRIYREPNEEEKNDPKRLDNTATAKNSWPCLLVFVSQWVAEANFKTYGMLDTAVPSCLYMPDGRRIPVCTIEVDKTQKSDDSAVPSPSSFPTNMIGGGFPMLTYLQGLERIASIGCIVTDGSLYYAITNKHVTCEPGTEIFTLVHGVPTPIGKSSKKNIGSVKFAKAYPGWSDTNMFVNADIGLMEIADVNWWTTGIVSIGNPGEMLDLNTQTLGLDLIGRQVKGYGCISGLIEGQIDALFYRYRSVGGFEYVSDFLIAPPAQGKAFNIHHGDSGTLLLVEWDKGKKGKSVWRPFSILWGRHRFTDSSGKRCDAHGLATCLSTACRVLGVDVVADWNSDQEAIWGKVGHFGLASWAITWLAAEGVPAKLAQLLNDNIELITFPKGKISEALNKEGNAPYKDYCPLADVPDIVWKQNGYKATYPDANRFPLENPHHFADIDLESGSETLASMFKNNPASLDPEIWDNFYKGAGVTAPKHKGTLPFRVWQLFDALKTSATQGDAVSFVSLAGVLTHYIGDACMPLHTSYLADGKKSGEGKGVHSTYEDKMIGKHVDEIIKKIESVRDAQNELSDEVIPDMKTGRKAAEAIMWLMMKNAEKLPPEDIVDCFIDSKKAGKDPAEELWTRFGDETIAAMARGCRFMIKLWNEAWTEGDGETNVVNTDVDRDEITKRVADKKSFVPSRYLKDLPELLNR